MGGGQSAQQAMGELRLLPAQGNKKLRLHPPAPRLPQRDHELPPAEANQDKTKVLGTQDGAA